MLTLRKATLQDLPRVLELGFMGWDELEVTTLSRDEESVKWMLVGMVQDEDKALFVADIEGEIVGMVMGYLGGSLYDQEELRGICINWFLLKEHRKGRASLQLVRAFEQWAEGMGASLIMYGALGNGRAARMGKLYTRLGYIPLETLYVRRL